VRPYFYLVSLLLVFMCCAQGKIVLVGGGSESDASYSWSNAPYQWAVNESANKKVAIISYDHSGSDNWLPNYFESLGATDAQNVEIATRADAQLQATYDDLMSYDVFFFKGGDQSEYYELYKDTKVTDAIRDKYDEGGVMAGTSAGLAILSGVSFTAEGGTVYPDQALANVYDEDITLKDDFTDILPGVIADSHFIERGRFARLLTFMGHWYLQNDQALTGVGVDDKTAVCIKDDIATVYGTGVAAFYTLDNFDTDGDRPVANDISATQVLHEGTYDLSINSLTSSYAQDISANTTE